MDRLNVAQTEQKPLSLKWTDNPSVQKLLDVIAAIIAEEYIQIAKQNPKAFLTDNNGGPKCE